MRFLKCEFFLSAKTGFDMVVFLNRLHRPRNIVFKRAGMIFENFAENILPLKMVHHVEFFGNLKSNCKKGHFRNFY